MQAVRSGTATALPAPSTADEAASLAAFFRIADAWQLTTDEQMKLLGSPPRSTFFKMKKEGGQLTRDQVERVSHLLNIYKCLRILYTDQALADTWVKKTNDASIFGGKSALDFMMREGFVTDIYQVRRFLDAQRG